MTAEHKDLSIIFDNISDLSCRRALISDEIDICFSLLAKTLKEGAAEDSSIASPRAEIETLLKKYCNSSTRSESIAFLREITLGTTFPNSFFSLSEDSYEIFSEDKPAVISYVKNNFNDAAYISFSKLFSTLKVSYGNSFDEICENVYNGICDYCILPIESVEGGKLFSFYSLIDKYDLKIFAVSDVDDGNSSKRTRYALLSRSNVIFHGKTDKAYFEFSVICDESYDLADILEAAKECSLALYRIDSIPVHYDDLTFKFYHVFEASSDSITPFLFYVGTCYPQLKPLGYYILV